MEGSMPERGPSACVILAALIVTSGLGCNPGRPESEQAERMATKTIQQVQEEHTNEWMALPGVVGTALGQQDGKPCILVLTASNTEQIRQKIPVRVQGYPVVIQYVGE